MKFVTITAEFTGYPDDTDASKRAFKEGETLEVGKDVPEAFAIMIVAKGLAEEAKTTAPASSRASSENKNDA